MTIKPAFKDDGKHYPIRYGVQAYTFPAGDTIDTLCFDDKYIRIEMVDGRILLIPLEWIPPLRDATPEERAIYSITDDRSAVVWDPDESGVNEILQLKDYLSTPASR